MAHLNKRGFAFTLDVAIAFTVFVLFLALIGYLFSRAPEDPVASLQMQRTADDVLTVLDKYGSLQTFNENSIEDDLIALAPSQYGMLVVVTKYTVKNAGSGGGGGGSGRHHDPCVSDSDCGASASVCCNVESHGGYVCELAGHHDCAAVSSKSQFTISTEGDDAEAQQAMAAENKVYAGQRTFINIKNKKDLEFGIADYYIWLQ
jgi:hypothetical protein